MICTWLNGIFCTLSRKRGAPADTIKGVLLFKISKKDPTVKQRPRKYFTSSIRGVRHQLSLSLQRRRVGECRQREFLFSKFEKGRFVFQNLRKGVFCCKNHGQSERIPCLSWYFLHHWCGRGEVKGLIAMASAIKGSLFFLKIGQYISSIYRYKLCAFETLLTR